MPLLKTASACFQNSYYDCFFTSPTTLKRSCFLNGEVRIKYIHKNEKSSTMRLTLSQYQWQWVNLKKTGNGFPTMIIITLTASANGLMFWFQVAFLLVVFQFGRASTTWLLCRQLYSSSVSVLLVSFCSFFVLL